MGCGNGRGVSQVDGAQPRRDRPTRRRGQSIETIGSLQRLRQRQIRHAVGPRMSARPGRLREDVAAVRPPARHLLQRVLPQVGEGAQAPCHLADLVVLQALSLEQELIQGCRDRVSRGRRGVVDDQLGGRRGDVDEDQRVARPAARASGPTLRAMSHWMHRVCMIHA